MKLGKCGKGWEGGAGGKCVRKKRKTLVSDIGKGGWGGKYTSPGKRLLLAGGVHAVKATARPAITTTTAGVGNPIVSVAEDILAAIVSVLSVLIPVLAAIILLISLATLAWLWRRRRRRKRAADI